MTNDEQLLDLLRHAAAAHRGEQSLRATRAGTASHAEPVVVRSWRLPPIARWSAVAAAVVVGGLAIRAALLPAPVPAPELATAPIGMAAHDQVTPPALAPTERVADTARAADTAMVLAVAERHDGGLSCVNWKDLALGPNRSLADLRPEELRSLAGLARGCGPETGRVWVVALQGPAGSLPRGDECAADFASCVLNTPGARMVDHSGTLVPAPCGRGVAMRMETMVVAR